ncbi:FBD-associated F-box protein [Raphanus sativus]|nr:FBD-associated F-box protein [Raphanus sativus]
MEQKSKIGGESLRNRDVVNEDRLSVLPDDLLLRILSPLRTEDAIYTSFLSKRWRYLWKMVPNLKFDSCYSYAFSDLVYKSLALHKAPFLESLHVKIRHERDASDVGIWIRAALARNGRRLILSVTFINEVVRFPSVLFSWNDTLVFLKLKHCIVLNFPSRVCLMSLRNLHLYFVMFRDEKSVCNLLSGCPRLEDLVVYRGSAVDVDSPDQERDGGGYVINAPSLRYLDVSRFVGREVFLIENSPELVEANVVDVYDIANENIMASLTSATRLCLRLSPLQIKYPTGSIFCQLVSLELCTGKKEWWNLLARMLDSSPKLQILKLVPAYYLRDVDRPVSGKWNQPKCVPECLLLHLETFVWKRFKWQREDEKELATYILQNSRCLKKAVFSTKPINPEKLEKLGKRREVINELTCVVRASSSSCHLVFKSE